MSLVPCPGCHAEIHPTALACPHCGFRRPAEPPNLPLSLRIAEPIIDAGIWVMGIVILLILAFAIFVVLQ